MNDTTIIILAAGKGTRMNSQYQKILHSVGGKPMVQHVYEAAAVVSGNPPIMVVGLGEDGVQTLFGDLARYVVQEEQLGTGHATAVSKKMAQGNSQRVIVTYGDMPLFKPETMLGLANQQAGTGAAVVMTTVEMPVSSTFGRVVRDESGRICEIVEHSDAKKRDNADDLINITEMNAGVYCFDADFLWSNINDLPKRIARRGNVEYYLTDMIEIAVNQGKLVEAVEVEYEESVGAGTRSELAQVEKLFRQRAIQKAFDSGVTIIDPDNTYIDQDVEIGQDTVIWPNSYIKGRTTIGKDCVIGPNVVIRSAEIADNCHIEQATIERVAIPANTRTEPFTYATPDPNAS